VKIGLIGNMNNNNFALMRYFRDLGADAHLLLYSNDGQDSLSHFNPEADTWDIEKWKNFIHHTNVPNAPIAALNPPLSWIIYYRSKIRTLLGFQDHAVNLTSNEAIVNAYKDFQILVSSGITPAILLRINRKVNIFYPYATGVEFLYSTGYTQRFHNANFIEKSVLKLVQKNQAKGIRSAARVLNYDSGATEQALEKIGVNSIRLAIPMVYSNERLPYEPPNDHLSNVAKIISVSGLTLVHHARLMWKISSSLLETDSKLTSKNSHWFIKAYAELLQLRPLSRPHLFIFEYGLDVDATKELIDALGISNSVTWLPKMRRKEIMWLLSKVSAGVGEFYQIPKMIWGGTGWEVLASGKPLIQGFNFVDGEFEKIYGYPSPPLLPVQTESDILQHLLFLTDSPPNAEKMGSQAKLWFDAYNGIGLAKKWIECLS
jgi:hypothetical protein